MVKTCLHVLFIFAFISCGKGNFPDQDDNFVMQEQDLGYYRSHLQAVNSRLTGRINGYVVVWANERQFYAKVNFQSSRPGTFHHQYIHAGESCPDSKADINGDGIIDFAETINFSGKALIPLDQNLSSRGKGFDWFPSSGDDGDYIYSRASSVNFLLQDLRSSEGRPNNHFIPLSEGEKLDLHRRTVIIYGDGITGNLPVACSELEVDPNPDI